LGTDDAREEFIEEEDGIEKGHMVGHHYGSYFSCCSSSFAPDPMISKAEEEGSAAHARNEHERTPPLR